MRRLARISLSVLAILSVLLLLATAALWTRSRAIAASSRPPSPLPQRGLAVNVPEIHFKGNRLADVVDFLRDVTGAKFLVDWLALKANGVVRETPVTLEVKDERLGSALAKLARAAGDGLRFVESNGSIYLTTAAA